MEACTSRSDAQSVRTWRAGWSTVVTSLHRHTRGRASVAGVVGERLPATLIVARKRAALRRRAIREIEKYFIDETPTPTLRWVVAFNDGMSSGMKMLGGVPPRRLVAASYVAAGSAYAQVNPMLVNLQAFLAAQSARHDGDDSIEMRAFDFHGRALPASVCDPSCDVFLVPTPVAVMR